MFRLLGELKRVDNRLQTHSVVTMKCKNPYTPATYLTSWRCQWLTAKVGVWNQTVERQCQKLHHEHPSRFTGKYQVTETIFSLQKTSHGVHFKNFYLICNPLSCTRAATNDHFHYGFICRLISPCKKKCSSQFLRAQVTSLKFVQTQ